MFQFIYTHTHTHTHILLYRVERAFCLREFSFHSHPGTPLTCTSGRSGKQVTLTTSPSFVNVLNAGPHRPVHGDRLILTFLPRPWLSSSPTKPYRTCIELGRKWSPWMDLGVQASSLEILMYSSEETKGNRFHRRKRSMNFRDGLAKREGEERKE